MEVGNGKESGCVPELDGEGVVDGMYEKVLLPLVRVICCVERWNLILTPSHHLNT